MNGTLTTTSMVASSVTQLRRAFDSMVLATLFTHEQYIQGISRPNWNAILEGVLDGVSSYDPIYVTMDEAAQYVRAIVTSDIAYGEFDPFSNELTTTLVGETDVPTQFYLFTEYGPTILEQRINVPVLSGSTQVITQLPGELYRIEVSPALVTMGFNGQQQFQAQGYDVNDVPVYAEYIWDVVNGGGTIDQNGLFIAGTIAGTFADTVTASAQGITGTATVVVEEVLIDHFAFDPVGDQVAGVPLTINVEAVDADGFLVTSYNSTAILTDTTGTIAPTVTGPFVNGVWTGQVTISQAATGVVISAQDGVILGSSNPFTVTASGAEMIINLWEDEHHDPVLSTFTDPVLLNNQDGQWDEFDYTARPYPTILAGHDEWENNGLQPIHFFAEGIPNGSYEVWVNLYTGRHTRHYYGFTEAEALAGTRWVDNVAGAGGTDQHEEYSLGIVEITDGTFDLWVGDGDIIDGTSYFYGWAWVRLAASGTP